MKSFSLEGRSAADLAQAMFDSNRASLLPFRFDESVFSPEARLLHGIASGKLVVVSAEDCNQLQEHLKALIEDRDLWQRTHDLDCPHKLRADVAEQALENLREEIRGILKTGYASESLALHHLNRLMADMEYPAYAELPVQEEIPWT